MTQPRRNTPARCASANAAQRAYLARVRAAAKDAPRFAAALIQYGAHDIKCPVADAGDLDCECGFAAALDAAIPVAASGGYCPECGAAKGAEHTPNCEGSNP